MPARISKDKRDIYYRKAKEGGYRARSAFKLIQLDDHFHLINKCTNVVDLCAAPGGWSQVLSERMKTSEDSKEPIVAVDLQGMEPLPGVRIIKGDITRENTASLILDHFSSKVDMVVVDGAPDVIGVPDIDQYIQHKLVIASLNITTCILKEGGTFISKLFRGKDCGYIYNHLRQFFTDVVLAKPKACRNSSVEGFVVCRDYNPPKDYIPSLNVSMSMCYSNPICVPFISCGQGYDSDQSYPLEFHNDNDQNKIIKYEKMVPKVMPIDPPYKRALEMKRNNPHKKLKTKH